MVRKLTIIFVLLFLVAAPLVLQAQETEDDPKKALEQQIADYEKKLVEIQEQKNTLSSQIEFMDTQVYLTGLRIEDTEKKIVSTQKEIETLGSRIEGLDNSLNYLSKLFLTSIVNDYKQRTVSVFDVLLDSDSANGLISNIKYYHAAQTNKQKVFMQAMETKLNFEEQKDLREKKKTDLDKLQVLLESQKNELITQKESKNILLATTQNDELTYQNLLEEARRQIASFKEFVQTTGAGIISANGLGTGEGGWYYSQRDERWAGARMGDSNESVLDVGCFITSISMVMKFYGADYTPLNIATNSQYFLPGSAYMYIPSKFNGSWPNGKNYKNISYSEISPYLDRNIPVIAGVRGSSHYVVLKKNAGDDFIMNDPIYGPDIKVSDYYSLSGPYGVFE